MAETLNVQVREHKGKRGSRKLRREGAVPAVLYGHKEAVLSLAIPVNEVSSAVRHGSRLVDLKGAVNEKAFIRDLQWDVYGTHVVHMDLTRISEHERVKVHVAVELRGEAPGTKDGGVVEHILHELSIECPVIAIPEKLQVSLNGLKKGDHLTVANLIVPEGVKVLNSPELIVVQCVEPTTEEDLAAAAAGAEPELIGRKAAEDDAEG